MRNIRLSMSKYPLGSNFGGTGDSGGDWGFRVGIGNRVLGLRWGLGVWGGDWVSLVFPVLNMCLSMSKYPLGSNLGGTGDWGGDWGFRMGIGFLRSFTC